MNTIPENCVRVREDTLRSFSIEVLLAVGMGESRAHMLSDLMLQSDLRGVFSHGTSFLPEYADLMFQRKVNPRPDPRLSKDTGAMAVIDGDGGMGHFAAMLAAETAREKAKELGIGAASSGNHFHIGAAGLYSRKALEMNCIGFCVSAHRFYPDPNRSVLSASGYSPMSFAIPAGEGPPVVIDMGCGVDHSDSLEQAFERTPASFFKMLGLGAVCHGLAGFMTGIWLQSRIATGKWENANQGAFVMAVDIEQFIPLDDFLGEITRHTDEIAKMCPAPGHSRAVLPGHLEWEREGEFRDAGIPIGTEHADRLRQLANRFNISSPV